MPLLKLWYDLRVRTYLIAALIVGITVVHVVAFPYLKALSTQTDASRLETPEIKRFLTDYRSYAEMRWFQDAEILAICAVLLSLGGVLTERRTRTIYLTLSFPIRRYGWLLLQAALVFALLLALTVIASVIFFIGGLMFQGDLSLGQVVGAAFVLVLVASPWIGITVLVSSLTQDRLLAAAIAICALIFINVVELVFPLISMWLPKTLMTAVLYDSASVWKPLLLILVSIVFSLLLAIRRFERMDY